MSSPTKRRQCWNVVHKFGPMTTAAIASRLHWPAKTAATIVRDLRLRHSVSTADGVHTAGPEPVDRRCKGVKVVAKPADPKAKALLAWNTGQLPVGATELERCWRKACPARSGEESIA
jgi:hypothetical protein